MKSVIYNYLVFFIVLSFGVSILTINGGSVKAADCDYDTVLMDCVDTAQENYENGDISLATYYEFQNVHCPAAATSCLEEA